MDQSRKKHNWKARRATVTKIDRSEEANVSDITYYFVF